VLSCLGATSKADAGVAAHGTRTILQAMGYAGVNRIVAVSAAPVSTVASPGRPNPPRHDPGEAFFTRHLATPVIRRIFRDQYADLARMEDALRDSDLEWTVVRPPRLTDGPATGRYRTAYDRNVRGGSSVSRADVANVMLAALRDPKSVRRAVGIAY
jgi:putative NADH-flavin reductase